MPMKRRRDLIGLVLASLFISAAIHGARGAENSAPGPMPGMEMPKPAEVPAANGAPPSGYADVSIAPEVQQRIGVTLGTIQEAPLAMTIRTVGIVRPDETKVAHIHLKTEGWVEKLFVSFTGQTVKAGEPMLSIYSPAFFVAQREYLSALRAAKSSLDKLGDQQIVEESARRRLELWDIPKETIEALATTGQPGKSLTLRSPISGTVLEKKAFEGQYVMTQEELYMVADLSTVWVQAKVFEYELPHVAIGMPVMVTLPSLPTREFAGKVVFIDPVVDEMSRSVQVRVELPNPDGQFKPGMFAQISITHAMGTGLTIPTSAVIRTGERDIAFRAVSTSRFVPVQVKISPLRFEDRFQVLDGLKAGDEVVTSANFLIDSESRLQAGGGGMVGMNMGDTSGDKKPAVKPEGTK
jgi:Cu(I)/Ag(I) efflux system membrane fusion protein